MTFSEFKDPVLQLKGRQNLYIENYRKLLVYTRKQICVLIKSGIIVIDGTDLAIQYYSKEDLEIRGQIDVISFQKQR